MNHYQATADHVICLIPLPTADEKVVGGIILPPNYKKERLDTAIAELIVHSVGPDCKTVRVGDRILYNRHNWPSLPAEDCEIVRITENQLIAVVTAPPEKEKPVVIDPPLTVEGIKAAIENGGIMPSKKPESVDAEPAPATD